MSSNQDRARPGQPFRPPPAARWNDALDAARRFGDATGATGEGGPPGTSPEIVRVKNGSGSALDRHSVLGISAPIFTPTDIDAFLREVTFRGVVPTSGHAGKFVVTLEPAEVNQVVRAYVAGTCQVKVSGAGAFAEVAASETGHLAGGSSGSAQVLWRDAGEGVKDAVVRFGSLCCAAVPDDRCDPADLKLWAYGRYTGCPDATPVPLANVEVTLSQAGATSLVRSTVSGGSVEFSAADLKAAGFRGDTGVSAMACIETPSGPCCLDEPFEFVLACGPGEQSETLPAVACGSGNTIAAWVIVPCCCPGDTFDWEVVSSDGNTFTGTFACGEGDTLVYCWPKLASEPDPTITITVTGTSRPAVYDISGSTAVWPDKPSVALQPAYACLCGIPMPRTLYLTDEFGTTELTYSQFDCRDQQFPPTVATVCGWCGKGVNAADPDATVYDDCGPFDAYKDQTADVPIYYRIEPAATKCQRRSTGDAGTWRLVRGAMSRQPGGTFHCDNVTERRPCAPAIAPDCGTEFPNEPRICCDFDECVELGIFNGGVYGIGVVDDTFCGDDPVLMDFTITGPADDAAGVPLPIFGMEKYNNGSAVVSSAAP
jgi:hypothetical protein